MSSPWTVQRAGWRAALLMRLARGLAALSSWLANRASKLARLAGGAHREYQEERQRIQDGRNCYDCAACGHTSYLTEEEAKERLWDCDECKEAQSLCLREEPLPE